MKRGLKKDPPHIGQQVGGMHPTRMHSCLLLIFVFVVLLQTSARCLNLFQYIISMAS